MEQFDTLFVINQEVQLADLAALCNDREIASAVLLTTHQLFPPERELFCSRWGGKVEIMTFADLLSEDDLCRCDETARASLLAEGAGRTVDYNCLFMARSLAEKNMLAYQRLRSSHRFQTVYYTPGLGVDASFWEGVGTSLFKTDTVVEKTAMARAAWAALRPLVGLVDLTRRLLVRQLREVSVIVEEGTSYIFFSPLKRLRIKSGVAVRRKKVRFAAAQGGPELTGLGEPGTRTIPCMTVHGYDAHLARALGGVVVFVDGYHPANYPPAYLDGYGEGDSFVHRTMYDASWFTDYGRSTVKPPNFLEQEFFASCAIAAPVSRVLVAMNHAGDWSSLISRSDTDSLISAVVEMARRLPQLSFRLRLHPTMDHPAHEGGRASQRVDQFVRGALLDNLHLSGFDLAEDLAWCEFCFSEYSQVLLDAWRLGKLGLAVNLTRRRSFMQDYHDLGFLHASCLEEATGLLRNMSHDPMAAATQQNCAVRRYNTLLSSWLDEKMEDPSYDT